MYNKKFGFCRLQTFNGKKQLLKIVRQKKYIKLYKQIAVAVYIRPKSSIQLCVKNSLKILFTIFKNIFFGIKTSSIYFDG